MMTGYGTGYTIDYGSSEGSMLPMIGLGRIGITHRGWRHAPMVGFGKGAIVGEVQFPSTAAGSSTIQLSGNMLAVFDSSLSARCCCSSVAAKSARKSCRRQSARSR